jgi:hypothetical protein
MEGHSHQNEKPEKSVSDEFTPPQVSFFFLCFFISNLQIFWQISILENYYGRVGCTPTGALLKKLTAMLLKVDNNIPKGAIFVILFILSSYFIFRNIGVNGTQMVWGERSSWNCGIGLAIHFVSVILYCLYYLYFCSWINCQLSEWILHEGKFLSWKSSPSHEATFKLSLLVIIMPWPQANRALGPTGWVKERDAEVDPNLSLLIKDMEDRSQRGNFSWEGGRSQVMRSPISMSLDKGEEADVKRRRKEGLLPLDQGTSRLVEEEGR